jgi:hypothetical protein
VSNNCPINLYGQAWTACGLLNPEQYRILATLDVAAALRHWDRVNAVANPPAARIQPGLDHEQSPTAPRSDALAAVRLTELLSQGSVKPAPVPTPATGRRSCRSHAM